MMKTFSSLALLVTACALCVGAAPLGVPHYAVTAAIAGPDGGWDYVSVDPLRNRLYVARSDGIMMIDLTTGAVTPRLASAQRAHQVLAIGDGSELVETDGATGLLRFIGADDGAVRDEVAVGKKPDAAIVDPTTGFIVVANAGDGTLALVDARTRSLADKIMVGGALEYLAADGRGTVWVNVEDTNELVSVDLRTRKITTRVPLTGCDGPTGLAFVAGGKRLISACANGIAAVTDPIARRVVATLTIGKGADGVKFDDVRGLAFIPCGADGRLEIVSAGRADRIAVVGRVMTAVSAKTAAVDSRTGKIYVPSATLLPPEPGAKRGAPQPGSFKVLVIAPGSKS